MIRFLLGVLLMLGSATVTQSASAERAIPVAVQLWSVRDAVKADFEGTLRTLADMGFQGVEFAGDYGPYADKPEALKALLGEVGLGIAGAHAGTDLLRDEALSQTIDFHTALGTPLLVIPYDDRAWSDTGVLALASELNTLDDRLREQGLRIGYHNHAEEMGAFGESTYWDMLAENTHNTVMLQLDVGWATYAGVDPAALVRRYPGRTATTHYKVKPPADGSPVQPFVGEGATDWPALVRANREVGGTQWLIVEQEDYPEGMTPLQCVEASLRGLERVLTELAGSSE